MVFLTGMAGKRFCDYPVGEVGKLGQSNENWKMQQDVGDQLFSAATLGADE